MTLLRDATLRQLCAQVAQRQDAPRELRSLAAACLGVASAEKRPAAKPSNRNHGQTARLRAQIEISPAKIAAMVDWARSSMLTQKTGENV